MYKCICISKACVSTIDHRLPYSAKTFESWQILAKKQHRNVALLNIALPILQEILQSHPFLMTRVFKTQGSQ